MFTRELLDWLDSFLVQEISVGANIDIHYRTSEQTLIFIQDVRAVWIGHSIFAANITKGVLQFLCRLKHFKIVKCAWMCPFIVFLIFHFREWGNGINSVGINVGECLDIFRFAYFHIYNALVKSCPLWHSLISCISLVLYLIFQTLPLILEPFVYLVNRVISYLIYWLA